MVYHLPSKNQIALAYYVLSETSAISMCFALCLMVSHPEVQEEKRLWPDIKDVPNGDTVNAIVRKKVSFKF